MNPWNVKDYVTADLYLKGGRKKYDRPLYFGGLRVQSRGTDIAVRADWGWGGFDIALFHPDSSMTIQAPVMNTPWGGSFSSLRSHSIRYRINHFSGLRDIFQRKGECYIITQDSVISPPKIQGCRSCSRTGLVDGWCNPSYCRQENCTEHPNAKVPGHGQWHRVPCEHGIETGHKTVRTNKCWSCNGMGMRDYGSKFAKIKWDGSPLRLRDGNIVKQEPTELEKRIAQYVKSIN